VRRVSTEKTGKFPPPAQIGMVYARYS